MEIEVKELEPCKLSIQYVADAGEILDKRGQVLQAFKKAPVPGFRPGKGSLDAIKMHYRSQIEESLKRGLAEDAYHNTIFEKKLRPHGAPLFKSILMADGKFTCEFEIHVKPEFTLAPYLGVDIPKPHADTNEVNFAEKLLQELRVKFGEAIPYVEGDTVQTGDNVIIDYEGTLDGEKINNLSAEGEMLTVGRSQLMSFDDNLIGMTLGETKEFDLVVPEHGLPSLAGKTLHFKVTLNMGSKTEPCPLDDTLAHKLGKKDFAELREHVNGMSMTRMANNFKMQIIEAISARLVADNNFAVPNWLSLSEAQYLVHNAKADWDSMAEVDKQRYIEIAEKNVRLALILDKVRESEPDAQITDQEVFEIIKQNLVKSQTKESVDDAIKEMNRTGYLQILFSRIKDEYALDFIAKKANIVE